MDYYFGDCDYIVEEPSDDDDCCISSDDEGVYQDVATGKLKLLTKKPTFNEDTEEEDFESLMKRELNDRFTKLEDEVGLNSHKPSTSNSKKVTFDEGSASGSSKKSNFYDDVYFDSDEEDSPEKVNDTKKSHEVLSNDELFYDPESDNEDQKWIDRRRSQYLQKNKLKMPEGQVKPLPKSDAVLNCPGCMTMLCLDCQRHEIYNSQYRAMFVFNCTVNTKELLTCAAKSSKKKKKIPKLQDANFNPVKCSVCGTEVAVYDKDEVYHFFNIIASHS